MNLASPPNPKSPTETADWVEFTIAKTNSNISKSDLYRYLESSLGSEPNENDINDILLELEKRQHYYGAHTPFIVENNIVTPQIKWEDNTEYMTCLILDMEGVQGTNTTHTGKLFERISNEAIKKYLDCKTIIFGHPTELTIEELAKEVNGKFNSELPTGAKDRRVDIIAWKEFDDRRNNQLTILFQCAAGANWRDKTTELPLKSWCTHILWGVYPLRGFTVPIIIPENIFDQISDEAGVVLDRIRIYKHIKDAEPNTVLQQDLKQWCEGRLAN